VDSDEELSYMLGNIKYTFIYIDTTVGCITFKIEGIIMPVDLDVPGLSLGSLLFPAALERHVKLNQLTD
jgi:hypothetical protein